MRGRREQGAALIIVILVMTFMIATGFALFTITRIGPVLAANIRWYHQVLNTAEAGVDMALNYINENMSDFTAYCRTTFNGENGLDDPASPIYFRKLSDEQLVEDVLNNTDNYIFASQPLPGDNQFTYTAFLVNDEAGSVFPNYMDTILVCIGTGPQHTYVRLELLIEMEASE